MQIGLLLIMVVAVITIIVCIALIILKFIRYKHNMNILSERLEKNRREEEILESKLPEIQLRDTGHSLDDNIKSIADETDVIFSMRWSQIIESADV